jgi:RNA polymerase sigma factor (sigma-70 family)
MAPGLPEMLERLRQASGGLTDVQLLDRFAATRDEASFAAIVRRHGPMVLGVCRRVLRQEQDAEDVFQATFLVLAQKASSVLKRESLGCWLYGVAYRTALASVALRARRRAVERQVKHMPQPDVAPAEVPDWRPLLDRELSRLSEKYRAAVVLCDLEGRTHKEAARLLGVPESTLANRLVRARTLLAKRLRGRGVTLPGTALAAALAAEMAAAVPVALVRPTVQAAAGRLTAASGPAVVLMRGMMRAMLLRKLKSVSLAVVVAAALGAAGLIYRPVDEVRSQEPVAAARGPDDKRPGRSADPAVQVAGLKPISLAPLREALNGMVMYTEHVQRPLPVCLKFIEDQVTVQGMRIDIEIDRPAIRKWRPDLKDIDQLQVHLRKTERPIPVKVALQDILDQYDLAFAVVQGRVLVGPRDAVLARAVNQPVNLVVEGVGLREALRRLSDQTGVNLVLDARGKEVPKVSLEAFEMPLHAAVRVLAEMADLKAVLLPGNVFFLTTKERAGELRKELDAASLASGVASAPRERNADRRMHFCSESRRPSGR